MITIADMTTISACRAHALHMCSLIIDIETHTVAISSACLEFTIYPSHYLKEMHRGHTAQTCQTRYSIPALRMCMLKKRRLYYGVHSLLSRYAVGKSSYLTSEGTALELCMISFSICKINRLHSGLGGQQRARSIS